MARLKAFSARQAVAFWRGAVEPAKRSLVEPPAFGRPYRLDTAAVARSMQDVLRTRGAPGGEGVGRSIRGRWVTTAR